jgi:putative transposase
MAECAPTYPVVHLCRALRVSPSGYSAWKRRQPCLRQQHDARLGEDSERTSPQSRQTSESPRLHVEVHAQGIRCGRKRIIRLMRQRRLSAQRTRLRCHTIASQHSHYEG